MIRITPFVFLACCLLVSFSVLAEGDEVIYVAPEDLNRFWVAEDRPRLQVRATDRGTFSNGCVRAGFIIESDGSVSTPTLRAEMPSGALWPTVKRALVRWRFTPGPDNPERVAVYTEMTTSVHINQRRRKTPSVEDQESLRAVCDEGLDDSSGAAGH